MFKKFDIKCPWSLSIDLRFFKNGSKLVTFQTQVDLKYIRRITNESSFLELFMYTSKPNQKLVKFRSVTWSVSRLILLTYRPRNSLKF